MSKQIEILKKNLVKPEILKGEVKEFIELDKYGDIFMPEVRSFYQQSFKPEMITEYFDEGICRIIEASFEDVCMYLENDDNLFTMPIPKTLSQFITNCDQAKIKLTWIES